MTTEKFAVTGMTCAACQANVTRNVSALDGIVSVNVNLLTNSMKVEYDENVVTSQEIINAVTAIGYGATLFNNKKASNDSNGEWSERKNNAINASKSLKKRLIVSVILLVPLMYVSMGPMLSLPLPPLLKNAVCSAITQMLLSLIIIFINRKFYISGFKGLIKRAPNMDTLVAIGSFASFAYSTVMLYSMAYSPKNHAPHLYFESAAMILVLVTVGKYLESLSKNKTTSALEKLVDLAPKTATVLRDGVETVLPAEEISVGDIIVIKPGDTLPVDGVITEGKGFLDQSAVTGESMPVEKNVGDTVICATANKNGHFLFKATRVGSDTTLSQIINLVDEASNSKAPISRIADKVSGVFVPIVLLIALITAAVWLFLDKGIAFALTSAVSVLVISCPCALGLATPVAIMVGTGKAANLGILVRSAETLENLHKVDTVVLDKTGTITSGEPVVTDVFVLGDELSESEFLKIAASLENGSNHPYALAIAKKYSGPLYQTDDFSNVDGRGISGYVDRKLCLAGNASFMSDNNVTLPEDITAKAELLATEGKTVLYFAFDGVLTGMVTLADEIRKTSFEAIKTLNSMNIDTVMLTGDNSVTAQAVKKAVGIKTAIAEVMPNDKEAHVASFQSSGRITAMVGDGINDAPALARADVGIAIGAGTDIAVETADVVLMNDSLLDVANAISLSRAVMKNIKLNLFWAFFYNVIGIPVAAGVFYGIWGLQLSPMLASAAMSLSSLFVVTNALRLRKFKGIKSIENKPKENNVMKKVLIIEGMMCMHCKANVEKLLLAVEGVSAVNVSLEEKSATVELTANIADEALITPVNEAGYKVISCK